MLSRKKNMNLNGISKILYLRKVVVIKNDNR